MLFISINVNSDRSAWIKGIEQGIYTSKPDLMLSTYGLGSQHPMLEFYHFGGYPQLLLIDKMGKIISSSPVKPSDAESLAKLDELIQAHL